MTPGANATPALPDRTPLLTPTLRVLLRIIAAVPLGYACCAAWVGVLAWGLSQMGLARSEAVVCAAMLGFILYLLVLLWAFSVTSLMRLWGVLAGGMLLGYGLLRVWAG